MTRPLVLFLCALLAATAARAATAAAAPTPAVPAAGAVATKPAAPPPSPTTQQAATLAQRGNVNGAITLLERDRAQLDPRGLSLLGALYLQAQRPADALSVLRPLADSQDAAAAVLYNAGHAAMLVGDAEHGQAYLARSVDLDSSSPAARELGMLLSREGRVVEAYALLRPWTLHHADDGDARLVAATLAIDLERPKEAEQLLTGLVESPAVQLMHARARVQLGDAAGALKALQPALAKHPPALDLEVRRTAAEAYLLAGQGAKAVEQLAGKTGDVPALVLLLARAQRQAGNAAAAMTTLAPLASRIPENPDTLPDPRPAAGIALEYGRLLLAGGKRDEALGMLQKAVRLNPLSRDAWEALAGAFDAAGRGAEAKQAREQGQRLARGATPVAPPSRPPAAALPDAAPPAMPEYAQAVVALMQQQKPQQALDLVRRQLAAAPDDLLARSFEVRLLLALHEFAAALKSAEAAMAIAPQDPNVVYQRGVVKMAMNDLPGAEADLRRALVLAPRHTAAMSDLAVLLMGAGKRDEARGLLEQVLRLNPGDKVAAANLEQLRKESH